MKYIDHQLKIFLNNNTTFVFYDMTFFWMQNDRGLYSG